MAAAPAPAPAHDADICAVCRGKDFVINHEADSALTQKPTVLGFGRVARTPIVKVHPAKMIECSSLMCRAKFHAGCIVGGGPAGLGFGPEAVALVDVPAG